MSLHRAMRRVREREVHIALGRERRAMATGDWPTWRDVPRAEWPDMGASNGWLRQVTRVVTNTVIVVLIRPILTKNGHMWHAAIRNVSNSDIPWRNKQRIKNEVFGIDRYAVEVFPPESDLVDDAEMYHLWVFQDGFEPGFGLHLEAR